MMNVISALLGPSSADVTIPSNPEAHQKSKIPHAPSNLNPPARASEELAAGYIKDEIIHSSYAGLEKDLDYFILTP